MSDYDDLLSELRRRSLTRGKFTLASGKPSSYYIDARRTSMSARGLGLVGSLGLAAIRSAGWRPDSIGGLTMGADPIAYAVAVATVSAPPLIDAFSVRKAAKQYGGKRRIEGSFTPGQQVVIAEDVITTGGSALEAIEAIRSEGGVVLGVLAIVDREEGGRAALEGQGIRVVALTTSRALLAE